MRILITNDDGIHAPGLAIAEGEALAGRFLAINPGRVLGTLHGQAATDPAYGLPAVWIDANLRDQAQTYGYTVVDASTVIATHLTKVIHEHAPELLGREETQQLLDHVAHQHGKLVEVGEAGEVFNNPKDEYTKRLLASIPKLKAG